MATIPDYVHEYYDRRIAEFFGVVTKKTKTPPAAPPFSDAGAKDGKSAGRTVLPVASKDGKSAGRTVLPVASKDGESAGRTVLPVASKDGPRGWLAAVIVHGGATAGAMVKYMKEHTHLAPYLMAYGDFKHEPEVTLDHTSGSLLMNHYAEFPPPSLPFCGPSFFAPAKTQQEWPWKWTNVLANGGNLASGGNFWTPQMHDDSPLALKSTPYILEPGWRAHRHVGGGSDQAGIHAVDPPELLFPQSWIIRSDGTILDPTTMIPRNGTAEIRPGEASIAWCNKVVSAGGVWAERGLALAPIVIGANHSGALKVPEYYRASDKRDDWYRRLVAWYHRAAWLVWAGEMMREHAPGGHHSPPDWWANHCAVWAVGTAHKPRLDRLGTFATRDPKGLGTQDSAAHIETMLRQIVKITPIPGSKGSLGDQIAPLTITDGRAARRHILDIPPSAGSIDPPYSMEWWMEYAVSRWYTQQTAKAEKAFNWQNTVINIEAGLCTMGFGSALTGVIADVAMEAIGAAATEIVSKIVNVALQNCFQMARGAPAADAWSWGDVVGLAGDALNTIGGSLDVPKMLPDGMWQALKNVGSTFPHIEGIDNNKLFASLSGMRAIFTSLDEQGWPYIDQAYGGLGFASDVAKDIPALSGKPRIF